MDIRYDTSPAMQAQRRPVRLRETAEDEARLIQWCRWTDAGMVPHALPALLTLTPEEEETP